MLPWAARHGVRVARASNSRPPAPGHLHPSLDRHSTRPRPFASMILAFTVKAVMEAAHFQLECASEQELHLSDMRPHVLLAKFLDTYQVELIARLAHDGPAHLKVEAYETVAEPVACKVILDLTQFQECRPV